MAGHGGMVVYSMRYLGGDLITFGSDTCKSRRRSVSELPNATHARIEARMHEFAVTYYSKKILTGSPS